MEIIKAVNGLEYCAFRNSEFERTIHGFFTRTGGVSKNQYTSLNLGGSIGDEPDCVNENKRRVFHAMNRSIHSAYEVWQIHSSDIVCSDRPLFTGEQRAKADGIFTSNPDVTLMMRFADCVPILLFNPVNSIVGIIHAGWLGTVNRIVEKAIERAQEFYKANPEDFVAGLGPSIGPDHYEIGNDVTARVKNTFNFKENEILIHKDGRVFLDLWKANSILLRNAGVTRIYNSKICTACDTRHWYSHRAEKGNTGRFGAIIGLKQG